MASVCLQEWTWRTAETFFELVYLCKKLLLHWYTGHFMFLWLLVRVWFCSAASVSPGNARSQLDQLVLSVWLVTQFHTNVTELLKRSITRCAKGFENTLVLCGSFPSSVGLMVVPLFQLKGLPLLSPWSIMVDKPDAGQHEWQLCRTLSCRSFVYLGAFIYFIYLNPVVPRFRLTRLSFLLFLQFFYRMK